MLSRRTLLLAVSPFVLIAFTAPSLAQTVLPELSITAPSPIQGAASPGGDGNGLNVQGTLPVVTDQFATTTVVPNDELRRSGGATLGDLLISKPGITGSGRSHPRSGDAAVRLASDRRRGRDQQQPHSDGDSVARRELRVSWRGNLG